MNPARLRAFFAANKLPILGTAAAGVTGLALLNRRKASGGAQATGVGGSPAGTIPAAAVVPGGGGGYDSSAYDVYSALQSQLAPILEQQRKANSVTVAPAPVASSMFKPGFYQASGSKGIYLLDSAGNRDLLGSMREFYELGGSVKNVTKISKDSTFFRLPSLDQPAVPAK